LDWPVGLTSEVTTLWQDMCLLLLLLLLLFNPVLSQLSTEG